MSAAVRLAGRLWQEPPSHNHMLGALNHDCREFKAGKLWITLEKQKSFSDSYKIRDHAKELCISPNIPLVEHSFKVSCLKTLAHVPQAHNQKTSRTSPSHQQAAGMSLKLSKFS